MCPSAFSSTLVMDVEGTDGRERGEDQVSHRIGGSLTLRTLNASLPCSVLLLQKSCLSTFGNTRSDCIKVPTWVF